MARLRLLHLTQSSCRLLGQLAAFAKADMIDVVAFAELHVAIHTAAALLDE